MKQPGKRWAWRGFGLLSVLAGLWVQWRLLSAAGQLEPLSTSEVERRWAHGAAIVDVRQPVEYRRGHIPGAISIPVTEMTRRWQEVPQDRETVLVCQHGPRAVVAGLILRRHGFKRALMLKGGFSHWKGAVER